MENKYRSCWEALESSLPRPTRVRNLISVGYDDFFKKIQGQDLDFVEEITNSIYAGDCYLLKGAFPKSFMQRLIVDVRHFSNNKPSSFYKMLEGSPDFHRMIDIDAGKKYSFRVCKHSYYFYRWNNDPLNLFDLIYERWRPIKFLMGLCPHEYEKNTPKDGVVDRIQIVRYPPKFGFLEPHSDPYLHQRFFFSGYMSKRGIDYSDGGFYLVGSKDQVVDLEDLIDIGDAAIGYATVYHGVATIDPESAFDWNANDGRWFLSMYSNASDEVKNRHTGHAVRLKIDGVIPDGL
ncbi:MAG: hypothetical protein EBZ47_08575 [Chlamydiae bacterium]|nr:hypothetical protein [Chlamydiota bacterium]